MLRDRSMGHRHDLVSCLLDDGDGSCRDLNFEAPTWKGLHRTLESLGRMFADGSVSNHEGQSPSEPYPISLASIPRGGGSAVLQKGTGPLSRLQVFVAAEDDGSPFIELTFFPEDVAQTQGLRDEFIRWADGLRVELEARRLYVRYENASWEFGDVSPSSGVFFVMPRDASSADAR